MQNAHQSALTAKHTKLDQQITSETQRPLPDQMLIAQLKKEKLRLKEELER